MTECESYELMLMIKKDNREMYPDGIDEEPMKIGSAREIIVWLLKHDNSVKHLVLKRKGR